MTPPRWHLVVGLLCLILGIAGPGLAAVEIFHARGDKSMSAPEAVYEYARTHGGFSTEQLRTLSAGVRHAHANYWGSSAQEPLFLLYPLSFVALAVFHFSQAARRSRSSPTPP